MSINVTFCGAAGTVTGSCYWISHPAGQFVVDCGLFQGSKTVKELNYGAFPFDANKIDFALLTHAHIDHSGLLPKLVKAGFSGHILATAGTRDLLAYMLPDSAHIQESDVERLNRRNAQRGRPTVSPIYVAADAEACLTQLRVVEYDKWIDAGNGVKARYWDAKHILGAASIELEIATGEPDGRPVRLLFSGDIGPEWQSGNSASGNIDKLDYVFCESTYGNRTRSLVSVAQRREILAHEVSEALKRGGNVLIPSFAVERTQMLLLDLCALMDDHKIPEGAIFLDSPLAIRATEVFSAHPEYLDGLSDRSDPFRRANIHYTASVDESKSIARFKSGAIIMSASGMCDAGRIRHHLKNHLWRKDCTVLIVGYQAPGSLGQLIADGKERVRIHGEEVAVRAEIRRIDVYSGHADQTGLVEWIKRFLPVRRGVFLTHGEDESRAALRDLLVENGISRRRIHFPKLDDTVDLTGDRGPRKQPGPRRLPPKAVGGTDWHNDYAQFEIDLKQALQGAPDDQKRDRMLRRLRNALKARPA